MSISKRIEQAFDHYQSKDFESALFQVCAAIEGTAKAETGIGGRSAYKKFIASNMVLVTRFSFGTVAIRNYRFAFDHPSLKPDSDGTVSLEDIIYHVVRCGLYHGDEIPETLGFEDGGRCSLKDGNLILPGCIVLGLIVAVVLAPTNKDRFLDVNYRLNGVGEEEYWINDLWGRRTEFLEKFGASDLV